MTVRKSVLESFLDADVAVFVVWIDILPSDGEDAASRAARIFDDVRVEQFYDPERLAGAAFARELLPSPPAWDVYLLYRPGQRWGEHPPRPDAWAHQLGGQGADPSRFLTGAALARALDAWMVETGFERTGSAPDERGSSDGRGSVGAILYGAAGDDRLCERCSARGDAPQCRLAGWRHVVGMREDGGIYTFRGDGEEDLEPLADGDVQLRVGRMLCSECPLRAALRALSWSGISRVEVAFDAGRMAVRLDDPTDENVDRIRRALVADGFFVASIDE